MFRAWTEGNCNPLQYSCLENPMDGKAWWATVHGSQTVGYDWATSLSLWWGLPGLYVCVLTLCSVLWFLMAILLCLATMWFRPAAILLELDFLSLCLETRTLRNTYLDHLLLLTLRKKEKKDLKLDLALCLSKYVLVCLCLWVIFLRLICIWALFIWLKKR